MLEKIDRFDGEYHFLSNFYPFDIEFEGLLYCSTESAYQAAKTLDEDQRIIFTSLSSGQSKKIGRKVTLRDDWEAVKISVMIALIRIKFAPGSELADKLLATGDKQLIEGNWWHDTFWGVCNGVGKNNLGKILMQVRQELREAEEKL